MMPDNSVIFVFGSNLAGQHGAGAARHAVMYWGAKYNVGFGRQGYAYAIPTKDMVLKTLPLGEIAFLHPELYQLRQAIPRPGLSSHSCRCGLAGLNLSR